MTPGAVIEAESLVTGHGINSNITGSNTTTTYNTLPGI